MFTVRSTYLRVSALLASVASAMGCGGATTPASSHPHGHAHGAHGGSGHGTLVHRFERAEDWTSAFDDPARDVWQKPGDVVAVMEIKPGSVVADIGAGTGYFEPWLSRAVGDKGSVLALDVEADMVRYMTERGAREGWKNVKAQLVAHDDPKLAPESVDRILIVDTWHHIAGRESYAAKLRAALRPQGKVFIVDFRVDASHGPPPAHRLAPERVAQELGAGGLTTSVAKTTLPEQYVVVGARP